MVEVVGSENNSKILSSVSPLLTFAGLDVRKSICDVLNALAKDDSSVFVVVIFIFFSGSVTRLSLSLVNPQFLVSRQSF